MRLWWVLVAFAAVMTAFKYETILKRRIFPKSVTNVLNAINKHEFGLANFSLPDVVIYGLYLHHVYTHWGRPWPIVAGTFVFLATVFPVMNLMNQAFDLYATNGPFILDKFAGAATLEASYQQIRREAQTLLDAQQLQCFSDQLSLVDTLQPKNQSCWKWFSIIDHHGISPDAERMLPNTLGLLKTMPDVVSASLSVLEPHTILLPHRGYWKGILRYHFGLIVPEGPDGRRPFLVCGGERYEWKEGEGVMFDDLYVHEVSNPTDERRVVLFLDIIRRDLPWPLDWMNWVVLRVMMGAIQRQDAEQHARSRRS